MPSADLYLKAPGEGHVIGYTLPLHWAIADQLRDGKLQRVAADGSPYEDEPAAVAEVPEARAAGDNPDGGSDAAAPAGPAQPRRNASKAAWAQYAVALGLATAEEADSMPRDWLIDLTTPPEMQPPEV